HAVARSPSERVEIGASWASVGSGLGGTRSGHTSNRHTLDPCNPAYQPGLAGIPQVIGFVHRVCTRTIAELWGSERDANLIVARHAISHVVAPWLAG
ncbi:MAG: hypothetical protein O3B31_09755, partial [Chloroflexi bacterium]|nr:hypothetical protein [Chloroflexota bacterium]